ncbi:hypothetical protein N7449_001566 [Penicillium cf. viridicatum]|uniref:Uncharacterized protein n=1 Tax=Penicillium cf. viridicatum TaxID=2972119 RepID=A0A9W9T9D2_9EURO|nr:hypothetical protein N7449_001566 [Penicillium cf. viridicatum]
MSRPPPLPPPSALGKPLYELRLPAILLEVLASESRLSFFYNLVRILRQPIISSNFPRRLYLPTMIL